MQPRFYIQTYGTTKYERNWSERRWRVIDRSLIIPEADYTNPLDAQYVCDALNAYRKETASEKCVPRTDS
jgi:hypothetical protein